ncbi:MAG: hypothetical protein HY924_10835 [Elusimicrobia bacterium]|nr:hypothetical protein [Elusimicrobiota bacterium]
MRGIRAIAAGLVVLSCVAAAQASDARPASFESLVTQAWDTVSTGISGFKTWVTGGQQEELYPPRTTLMKVGKCWTRAENAKADELGMPKEFCVDIVGVEVHFPYYHPFTLGSVMLLEGSPVSGRLHISGGAREASGWNIVGSLTSGKKAAEVCGELNHSGAAIYVGTDVEGRIKEEAPVSVRGFMFDGASLCRTPAKSVEVAYTLKP